MVQWDFAKTSIRRQGFQGRYCQDGDIGDPRHLQQWSVGDSELCCVLLFKVEA